jgi:hypothetical protein
MYSTVILAACSGCGGPDATVQGTVTIDGELASRGTVIFHPVDGGAPAYGSIRENGSYSLRVGQGDLEDLNGGGVRAGDYIVTVVVNMPSAKSETVSAAGPPVPGARMTARKYSNKDTSDLKVTITPGTNVVPLELEEASADETETAPTGAEKASEPAADQKSVTEENTRDSPRADVDASVDSAKSESSLESPQREPNTEEPKP